jgi:sigma-B regulation protein RsbU (phosphoserine phosphatase)
VGGDFCDMIATDDGWLAVVGDTYGKGTKAASLTGMARWALRTVALDAPTPAEALGRLNHVLVRGQDSSERCTVGIASIRATESGAELTVALGSHPYPLVVRRDGAVEQLGETALVIGWFADAVFTDVTAELATGDVMLMFTDGMLEALAGYGSMADPGCSAGGRALVRDRPVCPGG